MMLCLSEHFLMSLPQASAEAIFEISREIATANADCSITCQKAIRDAPSRYQPAVGEGHDGEFRHPTTPASLRPTITKGLLSGRSDGSRQDQIPRPPRLGGWRTAVPIAASERSKPTRGETRFLVAGATRCSFERLSAGNLHQKTLRLAADETRRTQ